MQSDIEKIAEHYGFANQTRQLFEEMAELTVAINKYHRHMSKEDKSISDYVSEHFLKENIIEEIADVQIMLWQMQTFFKPFDVAPVIEQKIARQLKRIEKEKKHMSKELEKARELVKMLEEKERQNKVLLSDLEVGEIIQGEEYTYKVLDHFKDGTTLIVPMEFMLKNQRFDNNVTDYKVSSIRKKVETECQEIFEDDFGKENLVEHEVDLTTVDMQKDFGSIKCKVAPPTFDEARKYNALLVNKDLNDWYWTCTSWSTRERGGNSSMTVVSPSGYINYDGCYYYIGVRPFCILKSNIFVSKKGE